MLVVISCYHHQRSSTHISGPNTTHAVQNCRTPSADECSNTQHKTHHLNRLDEQCRVLQHTGRDPHLDLTIRLLRQRRCRHATRVRGHDPDRVERDREELAEQQRGRRDETGVLVSTAVIRARAAGTHPESSETGPPTQSPPSSKYLKHPSRRASSDLSELSASAVQMTSSWRPLTLGAEEVVQRDAQNVDRAGLRASCALPVLDDGADARLVAEAELAGPERDECAGQQDDIVESDSHAAARERVSHVPGVAEKHDALAYACLAVRREERVRHASQPVLLQSAVHGGLELCRQLQNNVGENVALKTGNERGLRSKIITAVPSGRTARGSSRR
jgi:hypothetical protein